ncbi:MAG: NAD(P)H-hydrate dehydratase [Nitrospirae bacterium]|nr:NAD(P)H-hydrate dehydratase [Nitrospirota bacterium]
MKVATASEMREIDRKTIYDIGIPGSSLMERAGVGVAARIVELLPPQSVIVLAGGGNNGGDGLVVARELYNFGYPVEVFVLADRDALSSDCKLQLGIAERLGLRVSFRETLQEGDLDAGIVVDALVGTGLKRDIKDNLAVVIGMLNLRDANVVSIDVPSGICSDTGRVMGVAVRARWTVTFGLPKRGHFLYPGRDYTGELFVERIGFPESLLNDDSIKCDVVDRTAMSILVPERRPDSYKGNYGHLLVVAGARGKVGAALMCASAALNTGSGLVTLAVPEPLLDVYQSRVLEEMILPCPSRDGGEFSKEATARIADFLSDKCDCLAIGPGMGVSSDTLYIVRELLLHSKVASIVDADAINSLSLLPYEERIKVLNSATAPVILTPHTGEMARLLLKAGEDFSTKCAEVDRDRITCASTFAMESSSYVVLKGTPTITASPKGGTAINTTGTPAMAKAGAGDVLTGIIASLAGQGLPPLYAARLGVYLHGIAGEAASQKNGQHSTLARHVIECIGEAYSSLSDTAE